MSPEEAKIVANFLTADFEQEMRTTANVLSAVPNDRLDYQPDDKSKNGLGLVRHIALEDEWLLNGIADRAFGPPPDDSDACGIMTPADAVSHYQDRVHAALGRVKTMSGEELATVVDFFGVMHFPAVAYISLAMKHSVHHRGQLSAYLRAMGGKIPSIYGPSADTPMQG